MPINTAKLYKKIKHKLNHLRKALAANIFLKHFLYLLAVILILGFLLVTAEGFLYLAPGPKNIIVKVFLFLSGLALLGLIFEYFLIINNKIGQYKDQQLANMAGKYFNDIDDSLLNSIQLWTQKQPGFSPDLIKEDLRATYRKIRGLNFREIVPTRKIRNAFKFLAIETVCMLILFLAAQSYYLKAFQRITHPNQKFEVPLPFTISNISQQTNILGGDSVRFEFQSHGEFPDELILKRNYNDYQKTDILPIDSAGYSSMTLHNVRRDIQYEAYVQNKSIFIPWDRISSGRDSIRVTDRPEIVEIKSRIAYPEYTHKEDKIQDSQKTEYFALPGSRISFYLESNKELEQAEILLDSKQSIAMSTDGKSASGSFVIDSSLAFQFKIFDFNRVSNIKPISYKITTLPDKYPRLTISSPPGDMELNENMNIPIAAQISDDYGLSGFNIRYKLVRKYGQSSDSFQTQSLKLQPDNNKLQKIQYNWNLDKFNLAPEDRVHFKMVVYDNDKIRGPKKTESRLFVATFPSLNDMYTAVQNDQEGIYKEGREIVNQLKNTKEVLDKAHRKLLKNRNLSWEQKNQLKDEIKKTRDLEKKIKEISKKLDKVIKKAEENNLFDEKTLQKYMQLQETFQEIMTPELKQAMQEMQQMIDKMDPKKTQKALQKFRTSRDDFEKELDRQLELFKKIKAEQAMDELVKRMQDLAERQKEISAKLDTASSKHSRMLSRQESEIRNDTEIAEDIMKRTSQDIQNMPLMPSKEMQNILQKMQDQDVTGQMQQIKQEIQQNQFQQASESSRMTEKQLQEYQKMLEKMREDYRQKSMGEITRSFNKIIKNTMNLSKRQEQLNKKIKDTPAHSSRLLDRAVEQERLRDNLNKLLKQMNDLSEQTMGLSSQTNQLLGKSYNKMTNSVKQMEARSTYRAARSGQEALQALNMGSKALQASLQELKSSGSSTGYQNYMKRLKQMAQQQRQLNQQTRQMGQSGQPKMPSFGQGQSGLQQLAARQKQIRQSLENLQKNMQSKGQGGGQQLEGAGKDMEKVIEDLQSNKILQKTLDRQNRILTRMLDAQKSLRTQGYKKQRKSRSGEAMEYTGPASLPSDLGEKESYLRRRLEEALNNNYSQEYEELIRLYFEELSKDTQTKSSTTQ